MSAARRFVDAPRAAVRITGECPACGAAIIERRRQSDGGRFLGCSAFTRTRCTWTGHYDDALSQLAAELDDLRAELAEVRDLQDSIDWSRELRDLIQFAHPDRWPDASALATSITQRLNALRDRAGACTQKGNS